MKQNSRIETNQLILSRLKMGGVTSKTAQLTETFKGIKVNNTLLSSPKCAATFCTINKLSLEG